MSSTNLLESVDLTLEFFLSLGAFASVPEGYELLLVPGDTGGPYSRDVVDDSSAAVATVSVTFSRRSFSMASRDRPLVSGTSR